VTTPLLPESAVGFDTFLGGDPSALDGAARWLRSTFGDEVARLGTVVHRQRSALTGDWEGSAAESFGARATTLGRVSDDVHAGAVACAQVLTGLADALHHALTRLSTVRADAAAAGLAVSGTVIERPADAPPPPTTAPTSEAEAVAQATAADAYAASMAAAAVWDRARSETTEAFADWHGALESAGDLWDHHDADMAGFLGDLSYAGWATGLTLNTMDVLRGEAAEQRALAANLRADAESLLQDRSSLIRTEDRGHFGQLTDDALEADHAAANTANAVRDAKLPRALAGVGGTVTVAATGVGILVDIHAGESVPQAVTSNVAGAVAGVAFGHGVGAAAGAISGSSEPGAGTLVGAGIGSVVGGSAVSIGVSGAVDSLFENGFHPVEAAEDGAGDVVETVKDIGHVVGAGFDALH
jgi:uncharacterized protein YukE